MISEFTSKFSYKIYNGTTLKKEEDDIDVIKYVLDVIVNTLSIIILSLVLSFFLGDVRGCITSMISFAALRLFSGGYHFRSNEICIVVSTAFLVATPTITELIHLNYIWDIIILFIVLWLAPNSSRSSKDTYPKKYYFMKSVASLVVIINLLVLKSDIVTLTFFFQIVLILINKKWVNGK